MHGEPNQVVTKSSGLNTGNWYGINTVDNIDETNAESNDALENMTNYKKPALLYSISCSANPFDDYRSNKYPGRNLGEGFTVLTEAGGPAFLGNSRAGLVAYSYRMYEKFADLIRLGGTDPNGETFAHIGVAEAVSKQNYNGGWAHYLRYSHNLIGCPETEIWTAEPREFTNVTVTDNGNSVTINTGGINANKISVVSATSSGQRFRSVKENSTTHRVNTSIRPLYITITKHNYLPFMAITGGTLSENETFYGKLLVLGDITVPAGKTLTIEKDTQIRFKRSSGITVNGILNVNGKYMNKVSFNREGNTGQWDGIVMNPGGNCVINWAEINNAGIVVNNSNASITNTFIKGANKGISINNNRFLSRSTNLRGVVIDNCYYGIYLYNGKTLVENSSIDNCNYGVHMNFSNAEFGVWGKRGDNTIKNSSQVAFYLNNSFFNTGTHNRFLGSPAIFFNSFGVVNAKNNYWSTNPPTYYQATGYVVFNYVPVLNRGRAIKHNRLFKQSENSNSVLSEVVNLINKGKNHEALNKAKEILLNYSDERYTISLINLLYNKCGNNEQFVKLLQIVASEGNGESNLYADYLSNKISNSGVFNISKISKNYSKSFAGECILYDEFLDRYYRLNNKKAARKTAVEFLARYPESELGQSIKIILGEFEQKLLTKTQTIEKHFEIRESELQEQLPNSFDLKQNYPNPFNPETVIKYQLPEKCQVTIRVFNSIGKEVALLENQIKEAGYHQVIFEGSKFASGVYYYRIKAGNFVKTNKMLLVK